jgi:hypothetical protein
VKKPLIPVVICAALVASAGFTASPAFAGGYSGPDHGDDHGYGDDYDDDHDHDDHDHDDHDHDGDGDTGDTSPIPVAGTPTTRAEGLISPLSLDVDPDGTAYLSQNFIGLLTRVSPDSSTLDVTAAPQGDEIGSVSSLKRTVYFSQSTADLSSSVLKSITEDGTITDLADLRAFEADENPDGEVEYGFVDLPDECVAQFPPPAPMTNPASYTGVIDSHPYASYATEDGVYVADAGGNDVLFVDSEGETSVVAVLPPEEPVEITAELAAGLGLPACVAGYEHIFEPVPTDVELAEDGYLYVTTLPGGPEDSSLGARGSVYRIDPDSGDTERVVTGFTGSTGLAVAENGTIFVAELFGGTGGTGRVSYVEPGADEPTVLIDLGSPAAIELRGDELYVTTDSFVPDASGAPQPIGKLTVVPLSYRDAE